MSQDTTNLQNIAEQLIKRICRLKMNAFAHQKGDRYDVYLTIGTEGKIEGARIRPLSSNNEIINIEIQLKDEYNMINILNFKYLKTENFHTGYRLKEIHTHEELTDVIEVHFVEIPKLPAEADVTDMLVAWTEFLKNPESEKVRSLELSIKEVREAKDELIRMSNNEEQRALYEMRAKILKDKVSALNKVRREGMEEGLKEGRQEGLKEGAIRTAKHMIQRSHMTDEEIAEIAELSVEEVKHLRKAISF